MKTWLKAIEKMEACKSAIKWGEQYETIEEAWQACERGDWMLWLAGKLSGKSESDSRKKLVLTTCECARLALPYVHKGETRPLMAIETAEQWARGENSITLSDVRAAADAAADAAVTVAADAAAWAAADAAYVAYVADAAVTVAADAAVTVADAARRHTLKQCADIVRKHYPSAPRRGNK